MMKKLGTGWKSVSDSESGCVSELAMQYEIWMEKGSPTVSE